MVDNSKELIKTDIDLNKKVVGVIVVPLSPSKKYYKQLVKYRPKCKNYNCLVSNYRGECNFIGDGRHEGGELHLLKNTCKKDGTNWIESWGLDYNSIIKVPVRKLSDILQESNIPYIDFWSLDVEGGELEVLQSMDWNIPVYIICMEVSAWGEYGHKRVEQCRTILKSNGF